MKRPPKTWTIMELIQLGGTGFVVALIISFFTLQWLGDVIYIQI